jgi:hypothetical protein
LYKLLGVHENTKWLTGFYKNCSDTDFIYVGFCCSSRIVLCVLLEATVIGDAQSRERANKALAATQKAPGSDGGEMFVLTLKEDKRIR